MLNDAELNEKIASEAFEQRIISYEDLQAFRNNDTGPLLEAILQLGKILYEAGLHQAVVVVQSVDTTWEDNPGMGFSSQTEPRIAKHFKADVLAKLLKQVNTIT